VFGKDNSSKGYLQLLMRLIMPEGNWHYLLFLYAGYVISKSVV